MIIKRLNLYLFTLILYLKIIEIGEETFILNNYQFYIEIIKETLSLT